MLMFCPACFWQKACFHQIFCLDTSIAQEAFYSKNATSFLPGTSTACCNNFNCTECVVFGIKSVQDTIEAFVFTQFSSQRPKRISVYILYCTTCSLFVYWDWLCWCSMDQWDSLYPSEIEYFVETAMVKPYATLYQVISCHFQFSDQECGNLGEDYRRLKSFAWTCHWRSVCICSDSLWMFETLQIIAEFVAGCGKGVCFPCMLRASSTMFGKARVCSFLRAACPSRLLCLRWSVNLCCGCCGCCGRYGLPKRYGLLFLTKLGGCMSVAWLRMTTRTLKTWFSILAYSSYTPADSDWRVAVLEGIVRTLHVLLCFAALQVLQTATPLKHTKTCY